MRHSTAAAQWYGLSLLAHRKFNAPVVGRMGVTLRYDLLANSKNGGGGGGIALNGNGWTRATVSASTRTASRSRRPAAA